MASVIVSLLHSLRFLVRSRASLHLEILALRHQLAVVNRSVDHMSGSPPSTGCSGVALALVARLAPETHRQARDRPRILHAVDRARECMPLRALLQFLGLSPSRFHAWRRRQTVCALDDQSSCPRTAPHRLTPAEVRAVKAMVTSPEYRHVPTGTLAVLAQRLGTVWASPSTW